MEHTAEISELKELLYSSKHAVFFGGAGVSTESGIPDFRGDKGLYREKVGKYTPEYLLSRTCLIREPEKFFDFYRNSVLCPDAKPNRAHISLAKLEAAGLIHAVITQNIDGLHQAAGSKNVLELHGTLSRCRCDGCGKLFSNEEASEGVPHCDVCGAVVRPDVVLYEEGLDADVWKSAAREIAEADLLIIGGTSLVVDPAASLAALFSGQYMAIINYSPTPYDGYANSVIRASVADVLSELV